MKSVTEPETKSSAESAAEPAPESAATAAMRSSGLSATAQRLLADPTLPEPVRQFLGAGGQLERIVLTAEGQWLHEGEPFTNPALIALFSRSLQRTAGGTWVLHIPPFTYPVELADTPYYVRSALWQAERVLLQLNDDSEEPLDPASLRYVEGRGLYCRVKGQPGYAARLLRPAYYALASQLSESAEGFYLELSGQRCRIPETSWENARLP